MRVKISIHGFSEGARAIVDFPYEPVIHQIGEKQQRLHPKELPKSPSLEPYGGQWDVLYPGNCGSKLWDDSRIYAYNDSAASSPEHTVTHAPGPDKDQYPRHGTTRFVFQPDHAGCTNGYVISQLGARKLLEKHFATVDEAVDMRMQRACLHDAGMTCVSTYPPIFSQADSKSNMHPSAQGLERKEENINAGLSIQVSARVNANLGLAKLGPEAWKWEWRDGE